MPQPLVEAAPHYWRTLDQAARVLDRARVEAICGELIAALAAQPVAFPVRESRGILRVLRGKRYFALMEAVAAAFIGSGQSDAQVIRQLAQAQIDQGKLDAAIAGLAPLAGATGDADEEAEVRGLLGRACKQRYVAERDRARNVATAALRQAVDWYYPVYRQEPAKHIWHGINTVALLAAAARRGLVVPGYPDPDRLAREILAIVEDKRLEQCADTWDFGTAAEACVALNDTDGALDWARLYAQAPYTGEFELASTLRQLVEVWELSPGTGPFAPLVAYLQAELLRQGRGHQEILFAQAPPPAESRRVNFERVFADGRLEGVAWLRNGYDRALAVARIDDEGGNPVGTGFLVRGGNLITDLGDEPLLLTNAHVISDMPEVAAQQSGKQVLSADEARVVFTLADGVPMGTQWQVAAILWSSLPNDLDATLVRLSPPPPPLPAFSPYTVAKALPVPADRMDRNGQPPPPQPVWVFGHPMGRALSFSARNNVLASIVGTRLRYRAATEGGSSGGPVFSNEWKLIGLHHAGGETVHGGPAPAAGAAGEAEWNEGISILAILEALRQPAVRAQILAARGEAAPNPAG